MSLISPNVHAEISAVLFIIEIRCPPPVKTKTALAIVLIHLEEALHKISVRKSEKKVVEKSPASTAS